MAELKILRVFLILVMSVCLIEISSQDLVNEDYYSFEDTSNLPTEAPTYNKNIVTQNTTSTDALRRVSTSEAAINIMESDAGSGEGEINLTDKMGDLSTEKYYILQEDLPSAEEIFKAFDNETAEATTTSSEDLETTKDEHIKQIFEKLGVTKDMVTDLFGAAVTESIEASTRRDETLEKEFLLSASVNGNLQLTNWESVVVIDKDKDGNFLESDSKSTSTPLSTNKEIEDELFNIISDKDEEIPSKNFDSENKEVIDTFQSSEDEKLRNDQHEEEVTLKSEATTVSSIFNVNEEETLETNTAIQESIIDRAVTLDKDTSINDLLNYENDYGSRFEENYTHQTKSAESATVDPALYEYEARSSEDETAFSTTPKVLTETSESSFMINDNHRQEKELVLNGHDDINDKLDFESSTTIIVNEVTTEKPFSVENFNGVVDTDVSTEEKITSESTNLYNTQLVVTTEETEPFVTEGTSKYLVEEMITVPSETLSFITELSVDGALENAIETSSIVPTTLNNKIITTEALKSQNNHVPLDEDIISITTHTPTARILTESVSLVTENKVTSNGEATMQENLSDTNVNPCLKLNFTGQLKTNETTIPIPDTASLLGTCDSNGVFVNVSWTDGHKVKATIFFNFTADLLTNVQLNLLNDNTLFEQSKRVELGSTSKEITIEFENEHSLELTFFEFSTSYHDNSLATSTERFEVAPSSEELQSSISLIVLQIAIGCLGLLVVIAVAGFYAFKKYRGQRDNFKPNAETA